MMSSFQLLTAQRGCALCLAALMSGCGGGSSTSSLPTPLPPPPNAAPVGNIVKPAVAPTSIAVTLDASASRDPEGGALGYVWTMLAAPADSLAVLSGTTTTTVSFVPDIDGHYEIRLTVTDAAGASSTVTTTVVATSSVNAAPVVRSFSSSAVSVAAGSTVRFDWKVVDPNADATSCNFDPLGDGKGIVINDCSGTQTADYTYNSAGTYRPTLTATDARNATTEAILAQTVTGNPAIIAVTPLANALVGKRPVVTVVLTSTLDISSVVARLGANSAALGFSGAIPCAERLCPAGFSGVLDLTGVPQGEQTLEIIAQDVQGRQSRHYQRVKFDEAPTLTVTSPINENVALPLVAVTASCTDGANQACTVRVSGGPEPISGTGSVSRTIDLSAHVGKTVTLTFTATDSQMQTTTTTRKVFVENAPKLTRVASVAGTILHVKDDRVLFKASTTAGDLLYILDRRSNMVSPVTVPAGRLITWAALGNESTVMVANVSGGNALTTRLYHSVATTLHDLAQPNSGLSPKVSGDFLIWSESTLLVSRNLSTGVNKSVPRAAGNWKNDISSSGLLAFWGADYQIYLYDNSLRKLTNDSLWNTYVLTDGTRTVYRKHPPCCSNMSYALAVHDGSAEALLTTPNAAEPTPGVDYQVRDSWVAYSDAGNIGQKHVWSYDPQGNKLQRTFFALSSRIDTLGDAGRLMLIHQGRRYLSNGAAPLIDINSDMGTSYYINNQWYVSIGTDLFTVTP